MSSTIDNTSNRSAGRQALLAKWLKNRAVDQPHRADSIPRRADHSAIPLSFEQSRLWFFYQLDRSSPLYTMPIGIRLSGSLNLQALQKALDCVVARHEALRTHFPHDPAIQIVSKLSATAMHVVDLRGTPASTREQQAVRVLETEARRPFDLENDLMVRSVVVRLDEEEWLFLVLMHHIASDDWSWRVLCRELTQFYEAAISDRSLSLPEPALQYGDFAVWQRDWAKNSVLNDHLSYWRQHLNGAPTVLELPTDHPRPAIQSFRGGNEWFSLSHELSKKVKALSQSAGATVFTTLLSAFQILIFRYTRQETMLIGSPAAGRTRSELENVIGVFVNMLIFRGDFSGNPTVRDFLSRLQGGVLESLSHQDLPFDKLVEELHPARSLSYSPLVQVMFAFQDELSENLQLSGLKVSPFQVDTGTAKFDFTLTIMKSETGLNCCAEYSSDLFEPQSIRRLLEHYETLLNGMVSGGLDQRLSELPILSSVERRQLLQEWNSTEADFPRKATLHELFGVEAQKTPEAPAVTFNDVTLSYGELDRRSNQLARHLRSLGLGPECLIAVCMDRSLEMVIALMATLKAGCAYVPVDPSYPEERIRFMLEDSKAAAILTGGQKSHIDSLQLPAVPAIRVDADWPLISKQSGDPLADEATAESLAYVIYTSGSTGRPKGVMIPHRAVVNLLSAMKSEPGFRREDTLLSVTSISFDIAALEIFLPLISGAQLVLADSDTIFNGARLIKLIQDSKATVMQATPSLWKFLVDADWPGRKELRIFCGGEKLSRTLADQLLARGGELWNLYGPTETTIWSMACKIVPGPEPISIGRPVANTQIYLLDDRLEPVPIGVPGELHIAGDGVAHGYLDRADLTEAKFISNPFDKTGRFARLYKTGDIARYRPDGTIEWLTRSDHEIKLRGHRIDPGEIESILRKHPDIREALVAPGDVREQQELIAYLVCNAASPSRDDVEQFLAQKLPDYMIPNAIVVLDHFPLTPNGKIDRNALPRPTSEGNPKVQAGSPPRTSMEAALLAVWQEVLHREQVGVDDNFFRMGGHSLLAMQMASRVRKALHVDISLRDLFENSTIASLARCITGKEIQRNTDAMPNLRSITAQRAKSLLNKLEDISDEEVETLLHQLSPPEGKL